MPRAKLGVGQSINLPTFMMPGRQIPKFSVFQLIIHFQRPRLGVLHLLPPQLVLLYLPLHLKETHWLCLPLLLISTGWNQTALIQTSQPSLEPWRVFLGKSLGYSHHSGMSLSHIINPVLQVFLVLLGLFAQYLGVQDIHFTSLLLVMLSVIDRKTRQPYHIRQEFVNALKWKRKRFWSRPRKKKSHHRQARNFGCWALPYHLVQRCHRRKGSRPWCLMARCILPSLVDLKSFWRCWRNYFCQAAINTSKVCIFGLSRGRRGFWSLKNWIQYRI